MLSVPRENLQKWVSALGQAQCGYQYSYLSFTSTAGDPEKQLCLQVTIVGKVPLILGLQGMALQIKSVSNKDHNYHLCIWNESILLSVLGCPGKQSPISPFYQSELESKVSVVSDKLNCPVQDCLQMSPLASAVISLPCQGSTPADGSRQKWPGHRGKNCNLLSSVLNTSSSRPRCQVAMRKQKGHEVGSALS